MAPSATHGESRSSSHKSEKKHKREKSEHKKRPREEDEPAAADTTPRKSKKAKSEAKSKPAKSEEFVVDSDSDGEAVAAPITAPATPITSTTPAVTSTKKDKKKKKSSSAETRLEGDDDDDDAKSKKEQKKSKKHKKLREEEKERQEQNVTSSKRVAEADVVEVDMPDLSIRPKDLTKNKITVAKVPSDPKFPFFKQTFSIYVPLFPIGFDKPVTRIAEQHLDPLINHYSTTLKGVLLKYSNVRLSDGPTESGHSIPTTDTTPTLLMSRDEYAVSFGWLTFDATIFKPARGHWMEGVLQLQSEGYIGVVCWGRFNASIEAKRLPSTWKWIGLDKPSDETNTDADDDKVDEEEGVAQMHSTGYWVDEKGSKISGKLLFRILNFDVGLSGDHGYLSIEGTFLDDDAERAIMEEDREKEKRRREAQNPTGRLRPQTRRMPEFSVTKFGKDEEEELEDAQSRAVFQLSRPVTPDS